MSHSIILSCIAGVLQFIVAGYALRLNRLFGTARVGWSLFCAFALLALLHLVQAASASDGGASFANGIEVIYSLISFLLLTGMLHMEALLKERLRLEGVEQEVRSELESMVRQKTAHLTRAIEELVVEIDEHRRLKADGPITGEKIPAVRLQAGMPEAAAKAVPSLPPLVRAQRKISPSCSRIRRYCSAAR